MRAVVNLGDKKIKEKDMKFGRRGAADSEEKEGGGGFKVANLQKLGYYVDFGFINAPEKVVVMGPFLRIKVEIFFILAIALMVKGVKSGACKSASHQFFKDKAKNRVDDLQGIFNDLQSARKESRTIDVVVLEEQVCLDFMIDQSVYCIEVILIDFVLFVFGVRLTFHTSDKVVQEICRHHKSQ
ncbi:vascular plant one zinc finger protein [Perilla frutescens var. hirtella]|uniref:Vascular plant one zinc finger protein n=1 Tax=Perilla frutescens var. hirtella TaxID=608512 RepID=A0AAD4P3V2_PERFH|nr:vascular plant one zinc finger protein [Perilla frutescens var. hirtella]